MQEQPSPFHWRVFRAVNEPQLYSRGVFNPQSLAVCQCCC